MSVATDVDVPPYDPIELPIALGGSEPTPIAPSVLAEIEQRLAKGPVSLADMRKVTDEERDAARPWPTVLSIDGSDRAVFLPKRSNVITADAASAKSAIVQWLLRLEAQAGRRSLYLDREKSWMDFVNRMFELGVTDEEAELIFYANPLRSLMFCIADILKFATSYGIETIVIDTLNRDMSRGGCEENSNDDVKRWYDTVVEPLLRSEKTVVMVDHLGKPEESRGHRYSSRQRSGRGGQAKLDVITGVGVRIDIDEPFSRSKAGRGRVVCTKDNSGCWALDEVMAELHVTPREDGQFRPELRVPPGKPINKDGSERYTWYMEQVSTLLEEREANGNPAPSRTQAKKPKHEGGVGGNGEMVTKAIDTLVREGYVLEAPGARNAKLLSLRPDKTPYRQEDDPLSTNWKPI
jgi:hypothetical protein